MIDKSDFKVDFMLIGAPKTATTTLTSILRNHPEIGYSGETATEFFSTHPAPLENIEKYHNLFRSSPQTKVYGESSTTYSFYPKYGKQMYKDLHQYNPDLKFIYLVRDPLPRTLSQYIHWLERGYTDLPLIDSLKQVSEILDTSKYNMQISQYLQYFPLENFFIESFENFNENRKEVLDKLSQFLGVDADGFQNYEDVYENASWDGKKRHHKYDVLKRNFGWVKSVIPKSLLQPIWNTLSNNPVVQKEKPQLDAESIAYIRENITEDITQFKKLLNRDFKEWSQFNSKS